MISEKGNTFQGITLVFPAIILPERPSSSKNSHFQKEAKCKTFVEVSVYLH